MKLGCFMLLLERGIYVRAPGDIGPLVPYLFRAYTSCIVAVLVYWFLETKLNRLRSS